MINRNEIGYVIVSHAGDFELLESTFRSPGLKIGDNIVVVWSPNEGGCSGSHYARSVIERIFHDCTNLTIEIVDHEVKCLEARKIGFDVMMKAHPDIKFIQYVDSGDRVKSLPLEAIDDDNADIFWAPVYVDENAIKTAMYESCMHAYMSCSTYNVPEFRIGSQVAMPKEDYNKIMEFGELDLTCERGSMTYMNFGPDQVSIGHEPSKEELNDIGFAFMCPSIVCVPWRVSIVRSVFEYLQSRDISLEVNLGEDLLFHTIARYLCTSSSSPTKVRCKRIPPFYFYYTHMGSLTHKHHSPQTLWELAHLKGVCAGILDGVFDNGADGSVYRKPVRNEDESENVKSDEPTEKKFILIKDGVEYDAVEYTWDHDIFLSGKFLAWDADIPFDKPAGIERIEEVEAKAYIPNRKYRVIALSNTFMHIGKILGPHESPKPEPTEDEDKKKLSPWTILFKVHNEMEGTPTQTTIYTWDGKNVDKVVSRLSDEFGPDPSNIEILQLIKM